MRALLFFLGLLFMTTPAFALSDAILDYCLSTKDPKACIQEVQAGQERHQRELQRDAYAAQLEQARLQANGLALFGSGAAMINGMNQGFQNMQQPYINTPSHSYSSGHK